MSANTPEWFNDTDFWERFAPIIFDSAHWAEVGEVADGITRLCRFDFYGDSAGQKLKEAPQEAPAVLDLCCGFGRISAELARMEFRVTGVDITESYLNTAREEAAYENLNIEYINADAREFKRPLFFDAIVSLYISFGYFQDKNEDRLLLRNAFESLKTGGSFFIETLGKEIAVRDFIAGEWFERAGFTVLTQYETLDSWSLLKNRWILIKDGQRYEKTFVQRLYCASELREMLFEAGFSTVEIYGDWDERPYDSKSAKLIVVGRKL